MVGPRQAHDSAAGVAGVTRLRALRILSVAAVLASACDRSDSDPPVELTTIRVSGSPHLYVAPLYLAQAAGYFAERGLRVEVIVVPGSTAEAVPALATGRLDVITGRVSIGLFNAMAQGAPIRLVASQSRLMPGSCVSDALMIRSGLVENGRLPPVSDFRGRRIVVNPNTQDGYWLEILLRSAGLTLDDIRPVTIPNIATLEAMRRGSIDLAAVPEPHVTHLSDAGHRLYAAARDIAPGLQTRVLVFGPNLLEENPDAGRRFVAAYLEGVAKYNEGTTASNLDILTEALGMDREVLERVCWPSMPADGRLDLASLRDFQAWAVGKELLRTPVAEDAMWDPRFLEEPAESP